MKILLPLFLFLFSIPAISKKQERTYEMPCYRTEMFVKGDVRTCIWKCRDGSIESVTTKKQFSCPSTLFKRKGFE